ncbi:MAG: CHAT domain-containing protein [Chloroflexota bacterium]
MNIESFVNFDLSIEPGDYNFLAVVQSSPAGIAEEPISIPIHHQEILFFWQQMTSEFENPDADLDAQFSRAQDLGERLFRFVFPQTLQSRFTQSMEMAYAQRQQIRLRLILSEVPELTYLPWEFLYDPSQKLFLSLSPHVVLARQIDRLHQIPSIGVRQPLRMLTVIPTPNNLPDFDREREWLALVDTLDHLALEGKMIIEHLHPPTPFNLQRQLREKEYHILHFIGYGEFDNFAQDGLLIFEDEAGRAKTVSGQHLGTMLRDHNTLRLVNLNLRHPLTKRGSGASIEPSPFVAVAKSIVQRGIPAVITLVHEMPPFAMLTFYDELLSALTEYASMESAVRQARQAVLSAQHSAAWGVPIYVTRSTDGRLYYDLAQGPPEKRLNPSSNEISSLRLRYWQ